MLTINDRAEARRRAATFRGNHAAEAESHLIAIALLESEDETAACRTREVAYRQRIAVLQDQCESTTRAALEAADRWRTQVATANANAAAERRSGAAAVERIRAALIAGATDMEQRGAVVSAARMIEETQSYDIDEQCFAAAFLALSRAHAEARALLSDIGEKTRALLGKGGA